MSFAKGLLEMSVSFLYIVYVGPAKGRECFEMCLAFMKILHYLVKRMKLFQSVAQNIIGTQLWKNQEQLAREKGEETCFPGL